MKKLTLSMAVALVICLVISIASNAFQVIGMTEKLVRVHIIANSDSEWDQSVKLAVRDSLSPLMADILGGVSSKEEALSVLFDNLPLIEANALTVLGDYGCDTKVTASVERRVFPLRRYEGFTLPAGEYDSLCITIGSGQGRNFWCVLYPSLCIGSVISLEDTECFTDDELIILKEPQKVRYKLLCFELWQKIIAFFS